MSGVTIRVGTAYDGKGLKDAQKGLKNLSDAMKAIKATALVGAITGAISATKRLASATTGAFESQNKAITNLNSALQKNAKLTTDSVTRITKAVNKLPRVFDDDAINNAAAMASNMGLTEEQIKNVMSASVDLAASGIMPLDAAVKNLSNSYAGDLGQMKKLVPELRELTKEQLKNGDAVSLIAEKYKGYAAAMTGTAEGKKFAYNNAVGNLKASIGGIFSGIEYIKEDKLLAPITKLTEKIEELRPKILSIFLNIGEVGAVVGEYLKKVLAKTFSAEGFKQLADAMKNAFKNAFYNIGEMFVVTVKGFANVIKAFATNLESGDLGKILLNAFYKIMDDVAGGIIKLINTVIELKENGVGSAADVLMGKKAGKLNARSTWGDKIQGVDLTKAMKAVEAEMKNTGKELLEVGKSALVSQAESTKAIVDVYADENKDLIASIEKIMGKELPESLKKMLAGQSQTAAKTTVGGNSTNASGNAADTPLVAKETKTLLEKLQTDVPKWFADKSAALSAKADTLFEKGGFGGFMGGVWNDMLSGMTGFVGKLISAIASIENVQKILDPVGTIIEGIMEILEPVINDLLAPLVGVLKIVGNFLGSIIAPILQILAPIIESVCKIFVWLYNKVLLPVGNGIIWLFTQVQNGIIWCINGLIKGINKCLGWLGVNIKELEKANFEDRKLQEIDYGNLLASGNSSSASESAGSRGASYTAAKDVYVTINFNNSYVNGDARQIAIMLEKEIRSAERMGYI